MNSKPGGTNSKLFGTKTKSFSFRETRLFKGLYTIFVTGANSRARNCTKQNAAVARLNLIKRLRERRPSEFFPPALLPGNLPRLPIFGESASAARLPGQTRPGWPGQSPDQSPDQVRGRPRHRPSVEPHAPAAVRASPMSITSMGPMITEDSVFRKQMFEKASAADDMPDEDAHEPSRAASPSRERSPIECTVTGIPRSVAGPPGRTERIPSQTEANPSQTEANPNFSERKPGGKGGRTLRIPSCRFSSINSSS